jgi:hypothetical protein
MVAGGISQSLSLNMIFTAKMQRDSSTKTLKWLCALCVFAVSLLVFGGH